MGSDKRSPRFTLMSEFVVVRVFFILLMTWFFGVYLGKQQRPPASWNTPFWPFWWHG